MPFAPLKTNRTHITRASKNQMENIGNLWHELERNGNDWKQMEQIGIGINLE